MKYVVKAQKTVLKSPLTAAASSVILREFVDSKGEDIALASFGSWFIVVIKQGDTTEMIKCSAIAIDPDDGHATLTVATNGRNIDPTTPYAGYSTGEDFQSGADVIVTNDPLTMAQFGNINIANTWALLQTFSVAPKSSADAIAADELVRLSQLQSAVLGTLASSPVVIPGNAGETVAEDTLVYLNSADGEWYKCDADTAASVDNVLLGMTRGAGTDGVEITNGITILGEHIMTGLTANKVYFASGTAGAIVHTTPGATEVTIGFSRSTTQLWFAPRFNQQITEDQQDALAGTGTPSNANKFVTNDTLQAAVARAANEKILTVIAGETINGATLPVAVFQKASDAKIYACDGNDQTKQDFIGLAISNSTNTNVITVQTNGIVPGFSGLTPGAKYYVQDDQTIGVTQGTYEVLVGLALTATELLIIKGSGEYLGSASVNTNGSTTTAVPVGTRRVVVVAFRGKSGDATNGENDGGGQVVLQQGISTVTVNMSHSGSSGGGSSIKYDMFRAAWTYGATTLLGKTYTISNNNTENENSGYTITAYFYR